MRGAGACSVKSSLLVPILSALLMAGCAQNPDIRDGHGSTSGTTARSAPDYLGCVKGELQSGSKTYLIDDNGSAKLFVDSTDPNTAGGLVEVQGSGSQRQFTAYQRDAWYDHGRLLDAALMCKKA
ncbi:hypothetical protein [Pseudomonas sp. PSKL.D1]|uniref:hypothetical protein n=1 Tax=Pseudomonas sp. PSKL.D1 TaxID=3029060 RepID=UPI0023816FA4|nr:hypothetical protein [Pseudomonas sp. PSKL.D1]WDY60604.1 hypothetical protein PVV54_12500 [Pseudomonas sp. PSKL.D1]